MLFMTARSGVTESARCERTSDESPKSTGHWAPRKARFAYGVSLREPPSPSRSASRPLQDHLWRGLVWRPARNPHAQAFGGGRVRSCTVSAWATPEREPSLNGVQGGRARPRAALDEAPRGAPLSERERGTDRNEAESAAAWPRRLPGSHALPGLRTATPSASVLPRLGPAFEGAPAEMAKGGFLPHARLQLPSPCARASRCTVDHTPPGAGSPVGRAPFDSTPSLEPRPRPTEAAFTLQRSLRPAPSIVRARAVHESCAHHLTGR